jgi:hypothetical protein
VLGNVAITPRDSSRHCAHLFSSIAGEKYGADNGKRREQIFRGPARAIFHGIVDASRRGFLISLANFLFADGYRLNIVASRQQRQRVAEVRASRANESSGDKFESS